MIEIEESSLLPLLKSRRLKKNIKPLEANPLIPIQINPALVKRQKIQESPKKKGRVCVPSAIIPKSDPPKNQKSKSPISGNPVLDISDEAICAPTDFPLKNKRVKRSVPEKIIPPKKTPKTTQKSLKQIKDSKSQSSQDSKSSEPKSKTSKSIENNKKAPKVATGQSTHINPRNPQNSKIETKIPLMARKTAKTVVIPNNQTLNFPVRTNLTTNSDCINVESSCKKFDLKSQNLLHFQHQKIEPKISDELPQKIVKMQIQENETEEDSTKNRPKSVQNPEKELKTSFSKQTIKFDPIEQNKQQNFDLKNQIDFERIIFPPSENNQLEESDVLISDFEIKTTHKDPEKSEAVLEVKEFNQNPILKNLADFLKMINYDDKVLKSMCYKKKRK